MKIHLAGDHDKNNDLFMKKYKANRLFSFLGQERAIRNWWDFSKLMVDSGAHSWNKYTINKVATSATIQVKNLPKIEEYAETYIEFLKSFNNENAVFVELDTYGAIVKKYIDDMYDKIMCIPGRKFQFIRVYHPIIDNGSLEELFRWIDEGQTYIGLGNDSTYLFDKIFFKITIYFTRIKMVNVISVFYDICWNRRICWNRWNCCFH